MTNNSVRKLRKIVFSFMVLLFFVFICEGFQFAAVNVSESKKFQERTPSNSYEIISLINESDLYCAFFIFEDKTPEIKIIGAEKEYEKNMISDGDLIYINKGIEDGMELGQLFLIFEIGKNISGYGPLAIKRGRATIVELEKNRASAKLEKSCFDVMIGDYLVPFVEKKQLMGKNLKYEYSPDGGDSVHGEFIFLQIEINQIGRGNWALIDLGIQDGIRAGDQLVIFRRVKEGVPIQVFGNIVVIDTQSKTSTVKVLSCKDPIRLGDKVMTR